MKRKDDQGKIMTCVCLEFFVEELQQSQTKKNKLGGQSVALLLTAKNTEDEILLKKRKIKLLFEQN